MFWVWKLRKEKMWYEHGYSLIYFSSISFAQNQIWFWKWSDPKKKKKRFWKQINYLYFYQDQVKPHILRERESQHFSFSFFGVVISCFGDSYPFYSQDYIIIFSGLFSYFYYYNTNEKSFLEKLLGSLVILLGRKRKFIYQY